MLESFPSFRVSHVTKVTHVAHVEFTGTLVTRESHPSDPDFSELNWFIDVSDNTKYNLEEWLEKFKGSRVHIKIERADLCDNDRNLVEEVEKSES